MVVGGLLIMGMVFAGCASAPPKTATVELTGTPGAGVSGYYILNGYREDLKGKLPMTLIQPGLSQLAVRKDDPADNLEVRAKSADGTCSSSSPPGALTGLRLELAGGMNVANIPPEESLALPGEAVMTISPYWYNGTWVFDDAAAGLEREPFVEGVPEMVNALVQDLPNARAGFRASFSAQPFPGYQKKLLWVRAQDGGNVYRLEDPPMEGRFCPALFRYFKAAPPVLYVKAEPLKN